MATQYKSGLSLISEIRGGSDNPSIIKHSLGDSPLGRLDNASTTQFEPIQGEISQPQAAPAPVAAEPATPVAAPAVPEAAPIVEPIVEEAPIAEPAVEPEVVAEVEDDDGDFALEQKIAADIAKTKEKIEEARSVEPTDGYERLSYSDINKYTSNPMAAAIRKLAMEDDEDLALEGPAAETPIDDYTGLKNPNNFADSIFRKLKAAAIEGSKPMPKVEEEEKFIGPLQESTVQHKVALGLETVYMTTMESLGFIANVGPWIIEDPYNMAIDAFGLDVGKMSTQDYGKFAEDFLFYAYNEAGLIPEREELLNVADAIIYGVATNLSVSGVARGVVKSVSRGRSATPTQIAKQEGVMAGFSGGAAATADTIYGGDSNSPEQRKTIADYTAMGSSVGPLLYHAGRGLFRKPGLSKTKTDYEDHLRQQHENAAKNGHVTSDMRDLMDEGDMNHQLKMAAIYDDIKAFDPAFNPNVASGMGTQRSAQRASELANDSPGEMMAIHAKNQEILNRYIDQKRKYEGSDRDTAGLVELILTKQKSEVDYRNWLQTEHDAVMKLQREAALGYEPKGLIQRKLQESMIHLKDASSALATKLFDAVDPSGKLRIPASSLSELGKFHGTILHNRTGAKSTGKKPDDTMVFLEEDWAELVENQMGKKYVAWIREQRAFAAKIADDGVSIRLKPYDGYDAADPETWDFITYQGARNLQKAAYDIYGAKNRNAFNTDLNFEELSPLVQSVTQQIAKFAGKMGDKGMVSRLDKAVSYYRDEHLPRWKDRGIVTADFSRTVGKDENRRAILDYDGMFKRIWPADGGTTELREFNKGIKGTSTEAQMHQNLAEGVIGVVSKKLQKSKNPLETLDEYMIDNVELLADAPYVHARLMNLRHDTLVQGSTDLMEIDRRMGIIEGKLKAHTEMTKGGLKQAMLTANPESAAKLLDEMYNGVVQMRGSSAGNLRAGENVVNLPLTSKELANISSQVEKVYMQMLTSKFTTSYSDLSVKINHNGLSKFLADNEEVVSMFVGQKGLRELEDLTFLHNFDGKELANMGKLELNTFKQLLDVAGTNLGTMTSNYKQVSVGRLSRGYVAATAFQNAVKRAFDISDLSTFRATGFDWDMYKRALNKQGHVEEATAYMAAKDGLVLVMKGLGTRTGGMIKGMVVEGAPSILKAGVAGNRLFGDNEITAQERRRRHKAIAKYLKGPAMIKLFGRDMTVEKLLGPEFTVNDDQYKNLIRFATKSYTDSQRVTTDDLLDTPRKAPHVTPEYRNPGAPRPNTAIPNNNTEGLNTSPVFSGDDQSSVIENSQEEMLIADSAAELQGFRNEQMNLNAGDITRKGTFNPKTGEMTWLA